MNRSSEPAAPGRDMKDFKGPNYWLRQIGRQEIPVLRQTVMTVARVLSQVRSSCTAMAEAVAGDPFMAARLLRMANSAFYSPGIKKVNTINRAVVVVGFDALRQLCAGARYVEDSYRGIRLENVVRQVLFSHQQALLAQWFAESVRDSVPEEVYVAGLLADLGRLLLLTVVPVSSVHAFGARAAEDGSGDLSQVEKEIFGFDTRFLTAKLADEWKLGELLQRVARTREAGDPRVRCVVYAQKLTRALAAGADAPAVQEVRERIGDELKIPQMSLGRMMEASLQKTTRWGQEWGLDVGLMGRRIPTEAVPKGEPESIHEEAAEEGPAVLEPAETPLIVTEPDDRKELESYEEIHRFLMDREGRNSQGLMDLVAQALQNAVGLDRVLFLKLTPDRRFLEVKGLYGPFDLGLHGLMIPSDRYPTLFSYILDQPEPVWIREDSPEDLRRLVTPEVIQFFEEGDFFLARLHGRRGPVGVVGADRRPSRRFLDSRALDGFRRFCLCASVGMELIGL